jgi:hypothetical protein
MLLGRATALTRLLTGCGTSETIDFAPLVAQYITGLATPQMTHEDGTHAYSPLGEIEIDALCRGIESNWFTVFRYDPRSAQRINCDCKQ